MLTSQLLMPSPKMLKSKFPFSGGGGGAHQLSKSKVKFSKSNPELKFPFLGGGGGVAHQLTFDGEFKFAKIKNFFYKGFFKNFLSFRAKIGTVEMAWSNTSGSSCTYVQGEPWCVILTTVINSIFEQTK